MCILGFGASSLVGSSTTIEKTLASVFESTPAGQMRLGKIPLAADVEQILDAVEIEEESVAATAGEVCVVARPDEVGLGPE